MRMVRLEWLMVPVRRKVSEEGRPERAWRLIWGWLVSGSMVRDVGDSMSSGEGSGVSSSDSSAMNRSTRPLQR